MTALIDTSALLALSHDRDQYHVRAAAAAARHRAGGGRFIGTTLILAELYSHLLYLRGAPAARAALRRLLGDPIHEWVEVDSALIGEATARWLDRYDDQPFSLVDAVSFEVMRRRRLPAAFAFDHHFEIAGFRLLD